MTMRNTHYFFEILFTLFLIGTFSSYAQSSCYKTEYGVENEWITGHNIDRYNNRPLYINNTNAFVLTGDKPLMRLAKDSKLYGTLVMTVEREGIKKAICDFDTINSFYAMGQMKWELADESIKGGKIIITVLPISSGIGMALAIKTSGLLPSDKLNWDFRGEKIYEGQHLSWIFDVMGQPELLSWGVEKDEEIIVSGDLVLGNVEQYLVLKADENGTIIQMNNAEKEFLSGSKKLQTICGRLKIKTPDPYLNALAQSSVRSVDGTWYPPVFVHGCMQWNRPFPGWRSIFGGTMYGWHERVKEEAKYYIDSQVTKSDKILPKADPSLLLTGQHPDSRFYGVGRIEQDQSFYNMQSQFFDQLIEEYRWTNDSALISFLRPALELHLQWQEECFDPDGDGVYESYLNSWPTDSQWYNGGGSAEETSYAYRGHLAARNMALQAKDNSSAQYHDKMLKRIKDGFQKKLWIRGKGHSGAYREQGGHERLHENPWLYSIFLPVDAGLTSPLQSLESVYYSEWALQNDKMPGGGRQVWNSNWLPGIWSVRERWPGDNYHLALSYFQAGLSGDGWDIMKGTFMHSAFDHTVPGNLGAIQGGIDFGDCVHTFTRTLVSGLFGYRLDYPNNRVVFAPQFPPEWDMASISLPDFGIVFTAKGNQLNYSLELKSKADMELLLPINSSNISGVSINGANTKWEVLPGIGCSIVKLQCCHSDKVDVVITLEDRAVYVPVETRELNAGQKNIFKLEDVQIKDIFDPQGVFETIRINKGTFVTKTAFNEGYHTVVASIKKGKLPQWRVFRIKVNDPDKDRERANLSVDEIPDTASWKTYDISAYYNADVRTVYQQEYLSPRPNTVSARLGTDGYSPWTFPYWQCSPPAISFDKVVHLKTEKNELLTTQGVPFCWNTNSNNILFTSLWDNYPAQKSISVGNAGEALHFLVCGTTNVMQCQIANAVIYINYADGGRDSLELIPPVNYWNLSVINPNTSIPGQGVRSYYTAEMDRFCLPEKMPQIVELGENCTAMLLNRRLRKGVEVESISLETLSQEVVVGLMAVTMMNPDK